MKFFSGYNVYIKTLFVIGGFFGFSMAILAFMISPYLQKVLHTDNVSVLYLLPEAVVLLGFGLFLRMVSRFGKVLVLLCTILLQIILLSVLIFFEGLRESVALISCYLLLLPFIMMLIDMLLESHSVNGNAGRVRGMYILSANIGFFIAPAIAGFCVDRYGFASIFFLSSVCYSVMFVLVLLRYFSEQTAVIDRKVSLWKAAQKVWAEGDVLRIYLVSVLLEGFYIMTIITIPIYLLELGLTLSQIGLIFTVMLLPFLLFAYPAGRIADLHWGEKEILIGAMILLGVVLLVISKVTTGVFLVWMLLLFFSRVGAALIETMRDSYYFKHVEGSDILSVSFFRTASSAGILISSAIVFLFLYFGGTFQMLYVFYAVLCFLGVLLVWPMQDTEPERAELGIRNEE